MIHSILLVGVLLCLGFIYIKRKQTYWLRHGIPFAEPYFLFGNLKSIHNKERLTETVTSVYQKYKGKGPMIGLYFYLSPALIAIDLDLIRNILITDFQYFQDRGLFYNEKTDPLSATLFRVEHSKWKLLRSKLSPTFTSGKMKFMFPTIVAVGDKLVDCLTSAIQTDCEIEVYEWMGRYTTDVIGTCAFGIECNSLADPQAIFRQMCKRVFSNPHSSFLELLLMKSFARLSKALGLRVFHKEVSDFFLNIVKETVKYRETNQVERNDFMNLMIELKNSKNEMEKLTINEIAAQAFVFFLAGFDTSSSALNFCLYELAMDKHKHIQNLARHEIQTVLAKYNGQLSYEALTEMTYLDQILNGKKTSIYANEFTNSIYF